MGVLWLVGFYDATNTCTILPSSFASITVMVTFPTVTDSPGAKGAVRSSPVV
jgi:hypothetical protein